MNVDALYDDVRRKLSKLSYGRELDTIVHDVQRLNNVFHGLEAVAKAVNKLHYRVCKRLTVHRKFLDANYATSGLRQRTGKLYAAAVSGCVVDVDTGHPGMIKIRFAPGFANQVYVYGASQNYGAVHQPGHHNHPAPQAGRAYKFGSGLGAKAKQTIKKAAYSKKAVSKRAQAHYDKRNIDLGSIKVYPKHPFFYLTETQKEAVQQEYIKLFQEQVNIIIREAERGRSRKAA